MDFLVGAILEFQIGGQYLYLMNNKANFVKARVEYDKSIFNGIENLPLILRLDHRNSPKRLCYWRHYI